MRSTTLAIHQLADLLESETYEFNMSDPVANPECGSAGCIGGHAAVLWPEVRDFEDSQGFSWDDEYLGEKLGLSQHQTDHLCYPKCFRTQDVTRKMAVTVLRNLARTGEVKWGRV